MLQNAKYATCYKYVNKWSSQLHLHPNPSPYNHLGSLESYMRTLTEAKEMCLGDSVFQSATCDPQINLVDFNQYF